ncbi:hypothetical protein [Actinospica sp.]|uniref:hypothetical protein n=1 Tax=Actinospica sp. TaxID=1872142 RepID=UPI002C7459F7|nr:hypothetical protein [Actinospica sp.]HWG26668.1 hypothetical protein [Actinospica sp.]
MSIRRFSLPTSALFIGGAALALGVAPVAEAASASSPAAVRSAYGSASDAVFVQTDNTAGNQIEVYRRAADGTLSLVDGYAAGGLGGALTGAVVDHLASRDSLTYDAAHGLLYAVNAGSNTVSVFAVHGTNLTLRQVVSSGGSLTPRPTPAPSTPTPARTDRTCTCRPAARVSWTSTRSRPTAR